MTSRSMLARQTSGRQTDIEERMPGGVCFHTTGGGVTEKARRLNLAPITVAIDEYHNQQRGSEGYPWGGPTYVIDHSGAIFEIADELTRTQHVGSKVKGVDRREQYLAENGNAWRRLCSPIAVSCWDSAWPNYRSPQHLFPTERANDWYIGVEMIPVGDGYGSAWTERSKHLRFSEAQHRAAVALAVDIARRHKWPAGWWTKGRLVGHEDVGLIDRHNAGGGWDPGHLRPAPYFDFTLVRSECGAAWDPVA